LVDTHYPLVDGNGRYEELEKMLQEEGHGLRPSGNAEFSAARCRRAIDRRD
jgi:hypothetical protein